MPARPAARGLAQLLAIGGVIAVVLGYGIDRASVGTPFSDPVTRLRAQDESSYANSALGFANHGGWLTPKVLGRYQLNKPPLLVWLAGLSIKAFGRSLWALRLPALAAAICATLIVFWWTRRERNVWVACAAATLLLSNPLWHIFARLCYTDMLVAALTTGAMAILYADPSLSRARSLWGFAACVAACVMAKSVAGLLPLFILAVYWLLVRKDLRPSLPRLAMAALAAAALFAPWHIYQLIVHRQWFWTDYVEVQLLGWGTQPPGQNSQESAPLFYFRRLALTDPFLAVLFVISLPSLVFALRRRSQAVPALLTSWFVVITCALLLNKFQNLPYALSLIPPASLVATIFNPIFTSRFAKWGTLAVCAIFALKCTQGERLWGLPFGATQPLAAVAAMRSYYNLGRPNELILANSDDYFYATTLPLPHVRYYFEVHDQILRNFMPHYVYLGIMLTEDEFERLNHLEPTYAARLKSWGLDSSEPIGTAIFGQSDDALPRLVNARPGSDFYVTGADWKRLSRDQSIRRSHVVSELSNGAALLLALPGQPSPRRPAPLPASW